VCGKHAQRKIPEARGSKCKSDIYDLLISPTIQALGMRKRWSACRSLGFQVDRLPQPRPLHTRIVFVNQFTSDCCLGLIISYPVSWWPLSSVSARWHLRSTGFFEVFGLSSASSAAALIGVPRRNSASLLPFEGA
jgi:hypothetical protein